MSGVGNWDDSMPAGVGHDPGERSTRSVPPYDNGERLGESAGINRQVRMLSEPIPADPASANERKQRLRVTFQTRRRASPLAGDSTVDLAAEEDAEMRPKYVFDEEDVEASTSHRSPWEEDEREEDAHEEAIPEDVEVTTDHASPKNSPREDAEAEMRAKAFITDSRTGTLLVRHQHKVVNQAFFVAWFSSHGPSNIVKPPLLHESVELYEGDLFLHYRGGGADQPSPDAHAELLQGWILLRDGTDATYYWSPFTINEELRHPIHQERSLSFKKRSNIPTWVNANTRRRHLRR